MELINKWICLLVSFTCFSSVSLALSIFCNAARSEFKSVWNCSICYCNIKIIHNEFNLTQAALNNSSWSQLFPQTCMLARLYFSISSSFWVLSSSSSSSSWAMRASCLRFSSAAEPLERKQKKLSNCKRNHEEISSMVWSSFSFTIQANLLYLFLLSSS